MEEMCLKIYSGADKVVDDSGILGAFVEVLGQGACVFWCIKANLGRKSTVEAGSLA